MGAPASADPGRLVSRIRELLLASPGGTGPAQIAAAVQRELGWQGSATVLDSARLVAAELTGLGPLAGLLDDPGCTDVCVNGPDSVWVDHGCGMQPTDVRFPSATALRELAVRLAEAAGRRLDDAQPFVDAPLAGGVRLHAVLPPLAPDGPLVCLRTARKRQFDLADLQAGGTCCSRGRDLLARVVRSRLSFLVTGGPGSGKTTLLSAMLGEADPVERLVVVEDVAELRPCLPHVVRLQSRPANAEGAGGIDLAVLVREALRMRPDRLVVGECRGPETAALLAALNSGQEGGCATLHANRPVDVPARLEALSLGAGLTRAALHAQLAAGIAVCLHLVRRPAGRRLTEIAVLRADRDGLVYFTPAWQESAGQLRPGPGAAQLDELLSGRSR